MKLDRDITTMSLGQLRHELMRVRRAVRAHRRASGNARCWHNDLSLYAAVLPDAAPAGRMTQPEAELLRNCRRYIRRQQCVARGCDHAQITRPVRLTRKAPLRRTP